MRNMDTTEITSMSTWQGTGNYNGKKTDIYVTVNVVRQIQVEMTGTGANSWAGMDIVISSAERPRNQQGKYISGFATCVLKLIPTPPMRHVWPI